MLRKQVGGCSEGFCACRPLTPSEMCHGPAAGSTEKDAFGSAWNRVERLHVFVPVYWDTRARTRQGRSWVMTQHFGGKLQRPLSTTVTVSDVGTSEIWDSKYGSLAVEILTSASAPSDVLMSGEVNF